MTNEMLAGNRVVIENGVASGKCVRFEPISVTLNLFQGPFRHRLRSMYGERQPCVYILASKPRGTLYIGVTSDLLRRLWQHRTNALPGFTSRYAVHKLMRIEMFGHMEQAIAREKQLKRWHRQWKIALIESENPDWHDLAPGLGLVSPASRQWSAGS